MSQAVDIIRQKQLEDERHAALSATAALVKMDPHALKDLIGYMKALVEALAAEDRDEVNYVAAAILELFEQTSSAHTENLEGWESSLVQSREGRAAKARLDAETARFFKAYQRARDKSGLTTIRAIAKAAGLSPTTVQAIESQKVKPQYKTIRALAKGFGIEPEALYGSAPRMTARRRITDAHRISKGAPIRGGHRHLAKT